MEKKDQLTIPPKLLFNKNKYKQIIYELNVSIQLSQAEILSLLEAQWNSGIKALEEMTVDEETLSNYIKVDKEITKIKWRIGELYTSKAQAKICLHTAENWTAEAVLNTL